MAASGTILVEIAPGELVDKITILQIKEEQITDPAKLANVRTELGILSAARDKAILPSRALDDLAAQLKQVNQDLWDIEDQIRLCEKAKDFGAKFIELARSVYFQNDRRAALKRQISELLGSKILEEKAYQPYA
jgi:hypothetical protein